MLGSFSSYRLAELMKLIQYETVHPGALWGGLLLGGRCSECGLNVDVEQGEIHVRAHEARG